jgi:predicted RNase H-like HicB family nuclease
MNKVIIKDDSYFKELVRELSDERRALGVEEPQTDFEAVIRKWKESRKCAEREKIHRFLIIIEPENEHYHAYCPAVGDFHSRGNTAEEAKANLIEELRRYLTDLALPQDPLWPYFGMDPNGYMYVGLATKEAAANDQFQLMVFDPYGRRVGTLTMPAYSYGSRRSNAGIVFDSRGNVYYLRTLPDRTEVIRWEKQ